MDITGIILAGGKGTRLRPLTKKIPKPLLPVGEEPMMAYPLQKLVDSRITNITVVRPAAFVDQFDTAIGDGSTYGAQVCYIDHPDESHGMPYAIRLAAPAIEEGSSVCVLCTDVLFEDSLSAVVRHYKKEPTRAVIIAAQAKDTAGYSHIEHNGSHVKQILTKDANRHQSGIIDLGAAIYPYDVFEKARTLYPSSQEVPIVDLNNLYLSEGRLDVVALAGWWSDVGKSIEEYNQVNKRYE